MSRLHTLLTQLEEETDRPDEEAPPEAWTGRFVRVYVGPDETEDEAIAAYGDRVRDGDVVFARRIEDPQLLDELRREQFATLAPRPHGHEVSPGRRRRSAG